MKLDEKESELDLLEESSQKPNFWEDQENAQKTMQKVNNLKIVINPWRKLEKETSEFLQKFTNPVLNILFIFVINI